MDVRVYDNYVFMVAKLGSLTKAASALGISQPALSSGLNNLEKEMGIRIFDRKCSPIVFTPEGAIYFDYIKRMKVLTQDFRRRVDELQFDVNMSAVIGGSVAYSGSIVADAIIKLRRKNPDYCFSVKSSPLSELIELAAKGEINCFISTSDDLPGNFETRVVKKEKIYLCIPKFNPLNNVFSSCRVGPGQTGDLIDFSLLDNESFVFLEEDQPLQKQVAKFLEEEGVTPRCSLTVNQSSVAFSFTARGEGICFVSEDVLGIHANLDQVFLYSLPDRISGRDIYVAYDRELFMPKACADFIDFVSENSGSES